MTATNDYVKSMIENWYPDTTAAILVLDCAGSHTSGAALEIMKQFPLIVPIFVPPRMTSVLQPLDRQFFAPFKKVIKSSVARYMLKCSARMDDLSEEEKKLYIKDCMKKQNILNCLTYDWIPSALKALSTRIIRQGWTDICSWAFPQMTKGLHKYVYTRSPN